LSSLYNSIREPAWIGGVEVRIEAQRGSRRRAGASDLPREEEDGQDAVRDKEDLGQDSELPNVLKESK